MQVLRTESMDRETNSHFGESEMMLWRKRHREDSRKAHGNTYGYGSTLIVMAGGSSGGARIDGEKPGFG